MDANRDVSNLIDPMAQEFIYRQGLYLREPQDKPVLRTEDLLFMDCPGPEERTDRLLRDIFGGTAAVMRRRLEECGDQLMLLCDGVSGDVLGAAPTGVWTPSTCSPG